MRSPWLTACSIDNSASCLCTAATCGAGLLDAEQALFYARDPAAYVPPARDAEVLDNAELAAADLTPQASPRHALEAEGDTGGGASSVGWLLWLACALGALWSKRGSATLLEPRAGSRKDLIRASSASRVLAAFCRHAGEAK